MTLQAYFDDDILFRTQCHIIFMFLFDTSLVGRYFRYYIKILIYYTSDVYFIERSNNIYMKRIPCKPVLTILSFAKKFKKKNVENRMHLLAPII